MLEVFFTGMSSYFRLATCNFDAVFCSTKVGFRRLNVIELAQIHIRLHARAMAFICTIFPTLYYEKISPIKTKASSDVSSGSTAAGML